MIHLWLIFFPFPLSKDSWNNIKRDSENKRETPVFFLTNLWKQLASWLLLSFQGRHPAAWAVQKKIGYSNHWCTATQGCQTTLAMPTLWGCSYLIDTISSDLWNPWSLLARTYASGTYATTAVAQAFSTPQELVNQLFGQVKTTESRQIRWLWVWTVRNRAARQGRRQAVRPHTAASHHKADMCCP